ncbi:MAG TPA: protein-disulfide reductase DsbD [Steroidobacteraceae bacterium]
MPKRPLHSAGRLAAGFWLAAVAGLALAASGDDQNSLKSIMGPGKTTKTEFLDVDQAFKLTGAADGAGHAKLVWAIAPGYYLYRSRLKFSSPDPSVTLGEPELPAGDVKDDEFFGKQVVYHFDLIARLAVSRVGNAASPVPLTVTYQGCATAGLCYPPQTRTLQINLPAGGPVASAGKPFVSEQDAQANFFRHANIFAVLAAGFGSGLLLAFTPCVLPMVPILSGLIVGQGGRSVATGRAFLLSLSYVLGMAVAYTAAGIACAAAGKQVQALFQQPWIIGLFTALFVVLALSMFGLFELQMPGFIQTRLAQTANRQRAGTFGGVAVMGALSALIVTACIAPALVATLIVIGQSGDLVRGGLALFAMSLGMGTPLLVIGTSAGSLLPRAGAWMTGVKQLFGALMLGVAVWMIARLLPDRLSLALWAVPALAAAWVLWRFAPTGALRAGTRVAGIAAALYAVTALYGAVQGGTDPLRPLARHAASTEDLVFTPISSVADLDRAVASASAAGRPVLLDFYADWCTSCKEMERYTFSDRAVQAALHNVVLLRADVTANDADDQALLHHFAIPGPPTIALYNRAGQEQSAYRVVGYMQAPAFVAVLHQALAAGGA